MSFLSSLKSFMTLPGRLAQYQTQGSSHPAGMAQGGKAISVNGASVIGELTKPLSSVSGALASQVDLQAEAARSIRQATRSYV